MNTITAYETNLRKFRKTNKLFYLRAAERLFSLLPTQYQAQYLGELWVG